ncbi:MAG: hypothetical protein LBH71_03100, partial [Oscillospiraceae bacterium]|nr:hypothetical protein [Oscillospiraceae bacterium]
MRLSGITKRWILNTLLLIIIMLIIFITAFIVIMRSYYYNSVSLKLSSQYSDSVANFFSLYTTGTDLRFEEGAREFARIFTQKDIIEVWV